MMARPIKIGEVIIISKGKKHSISDECTEKSRRLIAIDDLRNDNMIRYTDDLKGTEAFIDDVLIAWDGANAGTIGYGKEGLIGSTIARLRFKEKKKYDTAFIGNYLKSKFAYLRKTATGATIPHISRKALEQILIPNIEYEDQKRIAHLLGKVEGLIAQRKQHLQQLDDLLKSVFLEMFGPKAKEYNDWPMVEIKDLAAKHKGSMRTGPFGSNLLHSEFSIEGDVAVIGIDNAVQNEFAWNQMRFISNEKYQSLKNYTVYPDDVIITIMGTIGRSAVIPDDIPLAINTKHLAAITFDKNDANPLFISYSIHSSPFVLSQFKSKNRGAIMSGLNLGIIKETKIKHPPIKLQNKFSDIHLKVDTAKSDYQKSLNDLETLYAALSQKAFKGELDLSRITLDDSDETLGETTKELEFTSEPQEIKLSAASAETVFTISDRAAFLSDKLQQAIKESEGEVSAQTLLANLNLPDFKYEGDAAAETLEDYELLKNMLFESIKNGEIEQGYQEGDESDSH